MDRLNETPKRVVVVGAGIVGAACALTLQRQGHQVTLVDGDQPGIRAVEIPPSLRQLCE